MKKDPYSILALNITSHSARVCMCVYLFGWLLLVFCARMEAHENKDLVSFAVESLTPETVAGM